MNVTQPQTYHLLVIDDNDAIHADFAKIFSRSRRDDDFEALDAEIFGEESTSESWPCEYELSFASQGEEGFQIVKEAYQKGTTFGVAFVDMRMPPGWDGVETIEHLWKVDPDLQVVICTAFSDHSWDAIASRLGHTDKLLVLKKPFDEIEAVQLANSLCEKRRLLDENRKQLDCLENRVADQQSELEIASQSAGVLIDSIASILISLDEDGMVSIWNPSAERTFGVNARDAVGRPITELPIAWDDPEKLTHLLDHAGGPDCRIGELQFVDGSGEPHTLDLRSCRLAHAEAPRSMLIVGTDVTEQRFIQAQLDQAQRLEAVGQLAAGVAHEINTPMQYIRDNVRYVAKTLDLLSEMLDGLPALVDESTSDDQLLQWRRKLIRENDVRKVRTSLDQLPGALADSIEGVDAVSKIVAAMKEFSHPGTAEKSQVSINHVLESSITVARNEWKYNTDVKTDLQENLGSVYGLPGELNQAFLNIIVNASHAISDRFDADDIERGEILITSREIGDCVEVTIRDNGGGIPMHARERVFEPFFTTKDVGRGTGQGLAIAHSVIVQKHQGKIWFDVDEGEGTTFKIQLPRVVDNHDGFVESEFCETVL